MTADTPTPLYKCFKCGGVGHSSTYCEYCERAVGDGDEHTNLEIMRTVSDIQRTPGERPLVDGGVVYDTELGNAERFVDQHLDSIRYCPQYKSWYVWDPPFWRRDDSGIITVKAKATVRSLYNEAGSLEDDGARRAKAAHARKSEGDRSIKAMLSLAQSDQRIVITPEMLDTHPDY
ncbi:unnamed protein product, partial [marine sediment metagenome]